jgi:hypothetical protein
MTVCPRCHTVYPPFTGRCARCDVPLLTAIPGHADSGDSPDIVVNSPIPTPRVEPEPDDHDENDDPLRLLLEEPIPEIAEMLGEFLKDCGIRAIVHTESIGRLYRLPVPLSGTKIYVRASELAEARELIQRFTRSN